MKKFLFVLALLLVTTAFVYAQAPVKYTGSIDAAAGAPAGTAATPIVMNLTITATAVTGNVTMGAGMPVDITMGAVSEAGKKITFQGPRAGGGGRGGGGGGGGRGAGGGGGGGGAAAAGGGGAPAGGGGGAPAGGGGGQGGGGGRGAGGGGGGQGGGGGRGGAAALATYTGTVSGDTIAFSVVNPAGGGGRGGGGAAPADAAAPAPAPPAPVTFTVKKG